ncbi:MATE family efflux transporter [Alkalitalea saponilacus]|nr:MATE family efflux transporter [Alkalitalea saponilacus]
MRGRNFFREFKSNYKANSSLALPVILSQAGQVIVVLADNLMVGRLGATHLAAAALANSIFIVGMMFGIGLVTGLTPLSGKAFGGGNRKEATEWFKQGIYTFPVLAIIQTIILAAIALIIPYMGQPKDVVELAIPYYLVLVLTLIPFQFFFIFKQYAEGLGNTRIAMVITISANILNIILNYILIYGKLGFPAYGLIGAGYATFIARFFMIVIFVWFFFKFSFFKKDRIYWRYTRFNLSKSIKLLKLGIPIGGQYIVEMLSFSLGSIMMGWISANALAAHQVVMSLVSFTYMISAGLASATTIKVSHFRGQGNLKQVRKSVFSSLHMVIAFMTFSLIIFLAFRFKIPALFVPAIETEVIAIGASLMLIGGLFQLFDGVQVVSLGALRGLEDVKIPTIMVIVAYFIIALPVSYVAAFIFKLGPQGIWLGYMSGLMMVSMQLLFRFLWLNRG